MAGILEAIVARKREEIDVARRARPAKQLERQLADAPAPRNFIAALARQAQECGVGLIAEVKRASPSAGVIRQDFDPVQIASAYHAAGAACLSCLTDELFFGGHLDHLRQIREAVPLPVLRKDFLLDHYQLLEARVAGADGVLLIAECLDQAALGELFVTAGELGMQALVELYEPANLQRVLALDPPLVGINNRNLRTFETSLEQTLGLAERVPSSSLLVSESGICSRDDVQRLQAAGVRGILVGEALLRSRDLGASIAKLLGTAHTHPSSGIP